MSPEPARSGRRSRARGRRRAATLAAALAIGLAGCPEPSFRLGEMQARHLLTAYDTLDYFRYAMRQRDWDAAYETLSRRTRDVIEDRFAGRLGFPRFVESRTLGDIDPHAPKAIADVLVVEILHRARTLNVLFEEAANGAPERAIIYLHFEYAGGALTEPFVLVREKDGEGTPRWRIGVEEWLELRGR